MGDLVHPEPRSAREQARQLGLALDAIEQSLADLAPSADADAIAAALAAPIRAFDLAAKEN